jgi:hypothetical protein
MLWLFFQQIDFILEKDRSYIPEKRLNELPVMKKPSILLWAFSSDQIMMGWGVDGVWWRYLDLNQGHYGYEPYALTS